MEHGQLIGLAIGQGVHQVKSKVEGFRILEGNGGGCSLFVLHYVDVFMPDASDINSYGFWGLLHNEQILDVAELISTIGFIGHIATLVMQILEIEKIKKTSIENQ